MNNRIKELAEQAGLDIIFHLDEMGVDGEFELWKFAELIVRECAEVAKHQVMNISTYADAEFVDEQIKKTFRS